MANKPVQSQAVKDFTSGSKVNLNSSKAIPKVTSTVATSGKKTATDAATRGQKKPKAKYPAKHAPFYGFPVQYEN